MSTDPFAATQVQTVWAAEDGSLHATEIAARRLNLYLKVKAAVYAVERERRKHGALTPSLPAGFVVEIAERLADVLMPAVEVEK